MTCLLRSLYLLCGLAVGDLLQCPMLKSQGFNSHGIAASLTENLAASSNHHLHPRKGICRAAGVGWNVMEMNGNGQRS